MLSVNSVFAAEQGLKARYVKFALNQQERFELAMDVTPEELFDMVDYDAEIIDDTAFYIEEADLKAKGDEVLQIENPTGDSPNQFGIIWDGTLIPEESGSYKFSCQTDNGFLMKIDGKVVLDYWRDAHSDHIEGETLELEAGKKYKIEAWYFDIRGGQFYKVWWAKDGGEKTQIPLSVLSTEILEDEDPTPTPEETPSTEPTASEEASPSVEASPSDEVKPTASPDGSPTDSDPASNEPKDPSPVIYIVIAAAVILIIGAVVFLVAKKKKSA